MAHNMLHRATTWAGTNLKPRGYTGALMDAGYLGWGDILGGLGRGLLDYGAQERAANAWRPLNSPVPPAPDIGRSIDVHKASLANAVQQRMALQNLRSNAALRQALLGTGVGPAGGPVTPAVAPPRVSAPPMPIVPITQNQPGGGQAFPSVVNLAPQRLPGSLQNQAVAPAAAAVSTMQQRQPPSGKMEDLPPHVRLAMLEATRVTPNDPTGAMKISADYWDSEWKLYREPKAAWKIEEIRGKSFHHNQYTNELVPVELANQESATPYMGGRGAYQANFRMVMSLWKGARDGTLTPDQEIAYGIAYESLVQDTILPVSDPNDPSSIIYVRQPGLDLESVGLPTPTGQRRPETATGGVAPPGLDVVGRQPYAKPDAQERLAFGFHARMVSSGRGMKDLEDKFAAGTGASPYLSATQFLALGSKNWIDVVVRSGMTAEQKTYAMWAGEFVRAKLRQESGAAIGEDEMAKEYASYIPLPADGPEVRMAKSSQRAVNTEVMRLNALAAHKYFEFIEPGSAEALLDAEGKFAWVLGDVLERGAGFTTLPAIENDATTVTLRDGTEVRVLPQNPEPLGME